jgi:hypothetical protein
VFILRGFKSFVLEVHILKGLRAHFGEVRILKNLAAGDEWRVKSQEKDENKSLGGTRYTPPRVFFVRVANAGLMRDAASRTSRKEEALKVEGLKLKRKEREERKADPSLRSG